jgi:nicotinamidase-related amidase
MPPGELPIPDHFDPAKVSELWRVDYAALAPAARAWAARHELAPAADDRERICLLLIDVQNTFCLPGYELFVAGRSGTGAVDDNVRLCRFIYRNLGRITAIHATLDTHSAFQIFHPAFWTDEAGEPPPPMTAITVDDVESGRWRVSPRVAERMAGALPGGAEDDPEAAHAAYALHYVRELAARDKYDLMIWPYHAILGGPGHALVSSVHEAMFFHSIARSSPSRHEVKGSHPLTEHYSAFGPEVTEDHRGHPLATGSSALIDTLLAFDRVVVAGQAKSHCLAWTVADLLADVREREPRRVDRGRELARKVYLLEDCTSPVVVPDAVDFTEPADAAFERFRGAGMHVVRSTEPVADWPDPRRA